ncbi:coiled-coil domain-containing protein [Obesumbacterium proteus]|uniref:hypothetical protein n=1 Tax=Obesumbacterium proteus TaxID=82983 RepID=UPI001F4481C6|nr:hypothetical protein [Obesumbacterium proteus]MCE9886514.1 hypothetical protein [Obesumbacterium proteus]
MSEVTDLTVIDIKPEQAPVLFSPNGLDAFLEQIKQAVNEVPDLSTDKGRKRIASLAAQISRSKTAIEKPGREYLKRLKAAVKPAEQEIKRFVDECDTLRDATRQPLTEWEAEQERIAAEKAAEEERLRIEAEEKAALEALKKQFDADHEIALLLNEKFDRDVAEAKAEAERQRIAHEEELKRQAAEQAKREADEAAKREIEAAAAREREALLAKELAERERIESEQRAEREKQEALAKAERERIAAEEKAKREKEEAIQRERAAAEAREQARLAEEKRIKDEEARRAADKEHRKTINNKALQDLIAAGVPEECAKLCITEIAKGNITAISINY